jgi:hypothetical protein
MDALDRTKGSRMTRLQRLAAELERLARKLADPPPPLPGFVDMRYWDEAEERFDDRQWMADQRQPGEW